ncbi:EAL domain-containing protein [Halothiobacillus sp.]|uniref:bifunctional diguanylate cyclase/phosphodiesterase n=1 Tax=Halothiobacillus sp. TaxID=1891311 RepID=UPI002AD3FBA3|nr:EAL domain-containing protein [Halothiobacillus sp.]
MNSRSTQHLMDVYRSKTSFSRYIWLTFGLFCVLAVAFVVYAKAVEDIGSANDLRQHSILLGSELREASNDLTRTARSYIATGNPAFKSCHRVIQTMLSNQASFFTEQYESPCWNLNHKPRSSSQGTQAGQTKHTLTEQIQTARFTQAEQDLLEKALVQIHALNERDNKALRLIDSEHPLSADPKHDALALLQAPAYYEGKDNALQLIHLFMQQVSERTREYVLQAKHTAQQLRALFIVLALTLLFLLISTYRALNITLGGSVNLIHQQLARIGRGDFTHPITITPKQKNSVLDWVSRTQQQLNELEHTRQENETQIVRSTRLYAALSQCNQAIVRCDNQADLFAQICLNAVRFGGMSMAWIGLIDKQTNSVSPSAAYGDDTGYLTNFCISLDPAKPESQGPIGTATRENQPYWSQDFQNDPRTQLWHEQGALADLRSSAAIPLHRAGQVVGAFSLYSRDINAFDASAQQLLIEMAIDISFALDNFERDEQRNHAERERMAALDRLQKITLHVPGMVYEYKLSADGHSSFPFSSDGVRSIYRVAPEDIVEDASIVFTRIHPDDLSGVSASMTRSERELSPWQHEYRVCFEDGSVHWLFGNSLPIREGDGSTVWTGFITDITRQKDDEARIAQLSHFDVLTGLPNRILLQEHIQYDLANAIRSRTPLTLMFLDLDHFKNINDTLGHAIGDELLVLVARRLQGMLRPQDTLSRHGGDEFILALPDCDADHAARIARRFQDQFVQPFVLDHHELTIALSIGIALYPSDGQDFATLSKHADIAMYRAKQAGRNGYRFFTPEMQTHSDRVMRLDGALRKALACNQFQLMYQPQIEITTGAIIGAEALLRWHHPELGQISPAEFIPIAEDNGQIIPIGEWVLHTAALQAKAWLQGDDHPFLIAVNLSAIQFRQPNLSQRILEILQETGLPPQHLELELTERIAMDDPTTAIEIITILREQGIRLSIDDFGTGYSSLSQLKRFQVYKLKIDQSFVRDMTEDPEDRAIVHTIITMAHSLGLITIAEGVENAEQLALLQEMGCEESQGYFTGRPMSAEALGDLLHAQRAV